MTPVNPKASGHVQRQIALPLSKAVEIAYKSIRLRLSRSLLVTSGIVLALAFLMSILAGEAMTQGMRDWIRFSQSSGYPPFERLKRNRAQVETIRAQHHDRLFAAARANQPASTNTAAMDEKATFGMPLADLSRALGTPLPASVAELKAALHRDPSLVPTMKQWIADSEQLTTLREELNGPQRLQAMMQSAGVPTSPQDIANNKIQTRWLIGLALLVAFVGILNAMLMSVTERFREIGTMKCLGALDSFIIKLFLIESLFQGIVGTILGVLGGLLLSFVSTWSTYGEFAWKNVQWSTLLTGIAVCTGVGILLTVAGALYPAWQAARMQPIEAMRSDV